MAHAHADCYAQEPTIDVDDGHVSIRISNFRLVLTALEAYRFYERLEEALDTLKAQVDPA